jgi:hypothetical protein
VIALDNLQTALRVIAPALNLTQHRWWILGSAAVALHGANPGRLEDVDILLDQRDCDAVFKWLALVPKPGKADGKFRSNIFGRWNLPPLPVELFAGFCLLEDRTWQALVPQSRIAVTLGEVTVFIPDRQELASILHRFARPKDLLRIDALSRSDPSPSRSGSA